MMEDLELQLKTLLETNWEVAVKPLFHRNKRRVEGALSEPNVIIAENTDVNAWDKEGMADCRALIVISTKIPCAGTTNEEVEKAKETKYDFREEVYRILKAMDDAEIEKPEGWEWAYPTRRSNTDNFDMAPALLGEDINITLAYQRT
jgi:hypothetical protein